MKSKVEFGRYTIMICLLLAAVLQGCVAQETNIIYVDNSLGSDCDNYDPATRACDAGSDTAYNTLIEAINVVHPGDTILVRGGTYYVDSPITIQTTGDVDNPIILKNYPGDLPELRSDTDITNPDSYVGYLIFFRNGASYWTIEGLKLTNFVEGAIGMHDISSYMNLTFRNLQILSPNYDIPSCGTPPCHPPGYGKRYGIMVRKTTNAHIENVKSQAGLSIYTNSQNALVENSVVSDTREDGFYVDLGSTATIRNCTSYNNRDSGFDITGPTVIEDSVAYGNGGPGWGDGVGFKFWGGPHYARGLLSYDSYEDGLLLDVRAASPVPGELHISDSTIVRTKFGLKVMSSQGSPYGSTIYMKNVIASYPDNRYLGASHRVLAAHPGNCHCAPNCISATGNCTFIDEGDNILYREPGTSNPDPDKVVIMSDGVDYTAAQINANQVPGLLSSTFSAIPGFVNVDSWPDIYLGEDISLYDFNLLASSPAIDNGTIISGYHCAFNYETDPNQQNCKVWYGAAPDIGAFEFQDGAGECSVNGDCVDANECTANICDSGTCENINCDLNGNQNVGLSDIIVIISHWGLNEGDLGWESYVDLNGNGNIGLNDIILLLGVWGANC